MAHRARQRVGTEELIDSLGITKLPGTLVDTNSSKLGIDNPAIVVVPDYPFHAVTSNFTALTLYPQSAALEFEETNEWQGEPLITTLPGTWNETGTIEGTIAMDADEGEREGPFNLALALTRTMEGETTNGETTNQRAIVIGDGDFLSNSYLGNGGNLDLGLAMVEWLSHDDALITIRSRTASDTTLELSNTAMAVIGVGFLLVVPVGLLGVGLGIWLKRRKR
ncbi:Gldg family protein [Candidatus Reidiella endopervernicosa]